MKRISITGAAEFLGFHLCDRFIDEDFYLIAMDNLITKDLKNISPEDDPKRRRPDINLAKSLLDWSPIIDLETGLQKTIKYFINT